MKLLAFDTATEQLSVAVESDGDIWVHESAGGTLASANLIPAVLALLARAGITLHALDAIAFGRGPGAFTGLRTACSVAQGLAFGANKPVLAIDDLLAVAEDARADQAAMDVWVTMDARMDEIYAAHYRYADAQWQVLTAAILITPAALNERWQQEPPQAVAGNALDAFADRLMTHAAQLMPTALPRACAMLALARAAWARGEAVCAAEALPLYLRDKVAQTTLERAAIHSAKQAVQMTKQAAIDGATSQSASIQ